jgi:hypothetical protein
MDTSYNRTRQDIPNIEVSHRRVWSDLFLDHCVASLVGSLGFLIALAILILTSKAQRLNPCALIDDLMSKVSLVLAQPMMTSIYL